MIVKVLLVNGSPKFHGCTDTALREVAGALNASDIETEIFWIGSDPIGGCRDCGGCRNLGKCVIDDVVNQFREKAEDTDGFIFGSPVHYAGASGNLIAFMDRLFFSAGRIFRMKPAAAVLSARRAGSTTAFDQINKYFTISEMPVVSSQYWNMVFGTVPEQTMLDQEGLQIMRRLGKNMAYLLKCMEAGRKAGVALPEQGN